MLDGWRLCFDSVLDGSRHGFDSVVGGMMHYQGAGESEEDTIAKKKH